MKPWIAVLCCAVVFVASAPAGAQAVPAAAAKPVVSKTESKTAAPAAAPVAAKLEVPASRRRSRANEDARACLEMPNTVSIIRCAEKFL